MLLRHYPLTSLWFVFIYIVCLIPVPETPLSGVIGFDKIVHTLLWMTASLLIWFEWGRAPREWKPRWTWTLTIALPVLASGSIELLQAYATTCRSGDWWDFLFNSAGVLLAALLVRLWSRKRYGLIALTAAMVALTGWSLTRWNVWFGNPDEPPYSALQHPGRVLLTFCDTDGRNLRVSWQCGDSVSPSFVEYQEEDDSLSRQRVEARGEIFESRSGVAAYYSAPLYHLKSGRNYRYRVCTDGDFSRWYSIRPLTEDHSTDFIYVGDVQDTLGGVANTMLRRAFSQHPEANFLVCGGDLTERPIDAYWAETFRTLDSVGQCMPVLTATGNHDYLKRPVRQLERRFSLIHSYFLDSMVGENQVFSVRRGNVQFFLLDSNRELPYLITQRRWLKEALAASTAPWKVVVVHHPLYSVKKPRNNMVQRLVFDDIIREGGVSLVLQGHEHAYARMTQHSDEGQPQVPVYTVSHCSPKSYRIRPGDRFDRVVAEGRFYQHIHATADSLIMTAYDLQHHNRCDSLVIVKQGHDYHILP